RRPRCRPRLRGRRALRRAHPVAHGPGRPGRGGRRRPHGRPGAACARRPRARDARAQRPRAQPRRRLPVAHGRPPRPRRRDPSRRPSRDPRTLRDPRCRMTTIALQPDTADVVAVPPVPVRLRTAVADTIAVQGRNLLGYIRTPQLLVFSTIQPVIFVLLFRYVFGGAIHVPGTDYVDFLMPGIFAQTVVFGAMATAIGLSTDLNSGLVERFRSLPIARSAFLTG